MRRSLLVLVLIGLAAAPLAARGRKKAPPAVDPELAAAVAPLIKLLDDPSFETREQTTRALLELGPVAEPALLPAVDHPSPEVRRRVRRILLHYRDITRRSRTAIPSPEDWPALKRNPGRGASSGTEAIRELPRMLWFRELPGEVGAPYFDSPLLAGGEGLFVVTREGEVHRFSRESGKTEWSTSTGGPAFAGAVLANGLIYVPGQALTALDANTGTVRWKWTTDYGVPATPLVHGGRVFAVEKGECLVALDSATGEVEWKARLNATSCAPVVIGDLVVAGTVDGLVSFRLRDGSRRWTFKTGGPVTSSPAILPDRIVFGDSVRNIYALDSEKGRLLWHRRIPEGRLLEAPVIYGDSVFFSTSGATFRALRTADGADRWIRFVGNLHQSSPCIAGGVAYFIGGADLYALECTMGDDLWRLALVGIQSAPILVDGVLYLVTLDGVLVAWR